MIFNSFEFAIFFIVVTTLYFLIPFRYRWALLLLASCYFYMSFVPVYILILGFTIVIDYFAGILIGKSEGVKRKMFLIMSLVANIGVLAVFKYYNFFIDNIGWLLRNSGYHVRLPYLSILLPIGLSFHTFQAMSYTIEVYRKKYQPERHFGIYALYVMFYPQLVAGPIERPQNIIHQFKVKHNFDYNRVVSGLQLMTWGLFKKVVIADRLSILVDSVYNYPKRHDAIGLIIGTIFFAYQIFCDFSGYTDMARGAARIMGFELMRNFNKPYHASSVSDFWSRWHISLSTWFRDYLYIPLGGNRVPVPRWYLNLFIVFLVSGLWHGASWTFIAWGALHGFYLIFALITKSARERFNQRVRFTGMHWVQVVITFALVTYAWIFFRAKNIAYAFYIATHIVTGIPNALAHPRLIVKQNFGMRKNEMVLSLLLIFFLELVHYLQRFKNIPDYLRTKPKLIRWSLYVMSILAIIYYGEFSDKQFIYFQF